MSGAVLPLLARIHQKKVLGVLFVLLLQFFTLDNPIAALLGLYEDILPRGHLGRDGAVGYP